MKSMNSMKSEFSLKYADTVMWVQHGKNKCLGRVSVSESGWPYIYVNGFPETSPVQSRAIAGSFTINSLILTKWLPQEGYYSNNAKANKYPFCLKRVMYKSWANSYGKSLYKITPVTSVSECVFSMESMLSTNTIVSIHKPTYVPINKAYSMIKIRKYIAVSPTVCLEQTDNGIVVLYSGYPFGTCIKNKKGDVSVKLTNNVSALRELFTNQGIPCR